MYIKHISPAMYGSQGRLGGSSVVLESITEESIIVSPKRWKIVMFTYCDGLWLCGQRRALAPFAAVKLFAVRLWCASAPLLEEKGNASVRALIA